MNKAMIAALMLSVAAFMPFAGCQSEKIQVIHADKVVTNTVPMKAFNTERYIWESWTTSTNRVENIDK